MATINGLVPMIHVKSVVHSIEYYSRLGFTVVRTYVPQGQAEPVWAWLEAESARVMLAAAGEPIDPKKQAVIFYLFSNDVISLRERLNSDGLALGEIEFPSHSPKGEFRLVDPDGYALIVRYS